jgi:ketosteroid isomerase-like protein
MSEAQAPRTPEAVRDFFTRWVEGSNEGDWQAVAEMMHPDIVLTDPMTPEPARGRAAVLERAQAQYVPFPDGRVDIVGDPFVALDEPVLTYQWRFTGTHLRRIDPPGFSPTGNRVELEGVSVLRFQDGLVTAVTMFFDTTGVARQVLAAPPAGSPLERVIAAAQRVRARLRRRKRAGRAPAA